MRVLVVSWYLPPQNAMGALRVGKLCKYLFRRGHDVRTLTVALNLSPEGRPAVEIPEEQIVRTPWIDINKPARPDFWLPRRARSAHGAPAREAKASNEAIAGRPTAPGPLRRLVRALDGAYRAATSVPDPRIGWYPFAVRAGRRMLADWRPEIVFASAPPFTGLLIGRRLARLHGVPWVAEYRDRFVEDPYSRRSWLARLRDTTVENWWLRGVAGIVTVSEPWAEDYRARLGVPVVTVYNGFDPEEFPADYPRRASDPATLGIVYTGILYPERRDPSPLFAALGLLGEDRARVRVDFYGADTTVLNAMAARHGVLDRVGLHARVPYRDSIDLQMNADVLLLLQWNDPKERGNVPGKLFEYLGARRPVLGIGFEDGVPARLLKERGAGIVLNDPARIADRLGGWIEQKRALGAIPLLPLEARRGFAREDQYALTERFLVERAAEGLGGWRGDGPARRGDRA
ncbi:MAG: glycosyltransferase [Alphaproteobacteria bacterium]